MVDWIPKWKAKVIKILENIREYLHGLAFDQWVLDKTHFITEIKSNKRKTSGKLYFIKFRTLCINTHNKNTEKNTEQEKKIW
jgi:hypothetical protein